ncbi:hypothetical protein QCA50_003475 [Cerrena zonata]|uniref:Uncharacterized protein n=1 Tax=Cerrena zonata TaxID=2478898 RepID=A0AAW0GPS9_9APHY
MPKTPSTPPPSRKSIFPPSPVKPYDRSPSPFKLPRKQRSDFDVLFPPKRRATLPAKLDSTPSPSFRELLTEEDELSREAFARSVNVNLDSSLLDQHKREGSHNIKIKALDVVMKDGKWNYSKLQLPSNDSDDLVFYDLDPRPPRGIKPSVLRFKPDTNVLGGEDIAIGRNGYFYSNSALLTDPRYRMNECYVYLCREFVDRFVFLGTFQLHVSDIPLSAKVWNKVSERLNGSPMSPTDGTHPSPPILVVAEFQAFDEELYKTLCDKSSEIYYVGLKSGELLFASELPKEKPETSSPNKMTRKQWSSFESSYTPRYQEEPGFNACAQSQMNPDRC